MPAARKTTLQIVLNAVNKTAGKFAIVSKSLSSIRSVGTAAFNAISGAIKRVGQMLLGLAGPMAAIQAIRLGVAFESDLAKIGTLGKEAREHLGEFRVELERIAVMSGTPLDDLASALFNMISAGVDASEAIKTLEEANRLAVAGSTDLASTVFALTKVMSAYGLSADKARKVSEILFATQVIGQTTVAEVAANFGKFTAIAASLKLPLEELATAFGDITKVASNSEEAATSLRSALTVLQKPSSELQTVMNNLGLTIHNLFDKGRSLGQVFAAITKESKRLGIPLAKVVGNVRAFVAAATLGQKGGARFAEAFGKFKKATSDLDVSLELLEATTARTLARFREFIKVLLTRVAAPWMAELNDNLKITQHELEVAKIKAEQVGLQILKWAKYFSPVTTTLAFMVQALSTAFRIVYSIGYIVGQWVGVFIHGITKGGKVLEAFLKTGKDAFQDIADTVVAFHDILVAMLWNVGGIVSQALLVPFHLLVIAIQESIKTVAALAWQLETFVTTGRWRDAPEHIGKFQWLEDFEDGIADFNAGVRGKMGQVTARFADFTAAGKKYGKNLLANWKGVFAAIDALVVQMITGPEVKAASDESVKHFKLIGESIVATDERLNAFLESWKAVTEGTLGAEENLAIKRLDAQLAELIKKSKTFEAIWAKIPTFSFEGWLRGKPIIEGIKTGWTEARAAFERYEILVGAGFTRMQAIVAAFRFPEFKPPTFQDTGLFQRFTAIKEAVVGVGVAWDNALGAAKIERMKLAWMGFGDLVRGILISFKPPVDEAKEAMDRWAMSVEDLRIQILQTAQGALANFFDQVAAGTANASDAWKAMLRAMLSALNKFMADRIVLDFLLALGFKAPGTTAPVGKKEKGGIEQGGFVPVREFAYGGIVTRPTLGLVGEGNQNEAIVPLPDGRSIPVHMTGGGQADSFSITIQAMDAASVRGLLLSDAGQRSIVAAFQNARATRRGFS